MNADSNGLQARQMIAGGELPRCSSAKAEAYQAAIQSTQAVCYSDWLSPHEAEFDYIATGIAPKFGVSAEAIAKRMRVE